MCVCVRGFYVRIGTDRRHKFYECHSKLCCKYAIKFVSNEHCIKMHAKDKHKYFPSFNHRLRLCAIGINLFVSLLEAFAGIFDSEFVEAFDSKIDLTILLLQFFNTFRLRLPRVVFCQTMKNGALE